MPRREPESSTVYLAIREGGTLDKRLRELAAALKPGGDNQDEVLTAINNLNGKVNEFMATQEERLKAIQEQLTSVADGINTLQDQVAELKSNNPDLDDEISGIESTLQAIKDDLNPSATEE